MLTNFRSGIILLIYTQSVCERGDIVDSIEIGNRIRNLRKNRGLTQKELAEQLEISESAITMYESGRRVPRDEMKVSIAKFFEKSVDSIFFE